MDRKWSIFLIIIVLIKLHEKKFPRFFKRIELLCALVASGLIIFYCAFPLYGVYDVLTIEVSNGDYEKILVESPCLLHGGKLGMFSNGNPLFRKMDNRDTA